MSEPPVPPEILQALRELDGPTVWNAAVGLNLRDRTAGYAAVGLACQFPELKPMVGYAVTCTADCSTPGRRGPNALGELLEAIERAPKPAVVVMQEVGVDPERGALIGDILATIFQRLGGVGFVSNGCIRDRSGIRRRAPGFQVFAPGSVVGAGNFAVREIGVPTAFHGLEIRPGELLHGDENGLQTVPREAAAAVVAQAPKVLDFEREAFKYLETEPFSAAEWRRRFLH